MNAALYYRVSTVRQQKEQTIDSQKRILPQVAAQRGWEIFQEYTDDGISGETIEARPAFRRLLDDAEKGLFDVLLVIDLDRITRSKKSAEGALIYDHFRECDVKLATPTELIDLANEDHDFLAGIKREMAKWEKRKILSRTKRGMEEAFLRGEHHGGSIPEPYYYDVEKNILIDPEQKTKVLEALRLIKKLSTLKVAQITGYSVRQLHRMATEKRLLFYCAIRKDSHGNILECQWPPIMTWEEAKDIISEKKRRYNTSRVTKYLLTGMGTCLCGYCGKTIKSYTTKKINAQGESKHHRYYRCHSRSVGSSCPTHKMLKADELEARILNNLSNALRQISPDSYKSEVPETLDKQLTKLTQEKKNIVDAIKTLGLDPDLQKNFLRVKGEIEAIQTQKDALKGLKNEDLKFISGVNIDKLNFDELKELLQICTRSITIYNHYVNIEFSFNFGNPPRYTSRIHLVRATPQFKK